MLLEPNIIESIVVAVVVTVAPLFDNEVPDIILPLPTIKALVVAPENVLLLPNIILLIEFLLILL